MNYLELCTRMEIAAISNTLLSIRNEFLTRLPSDLAEAILIQDYEGSYSKLYWYLTEIANQSRPLTNNDIGKIRNIAGYLTRKVNGDDQVESIQATMIILINLVNRPHHADHTKTPVMVTRVS